MLFLQVWFKNRRAKCRQQQKHHQQQQQNGGEKASSGGPPSGSAGSKSKSSVAVAVCNKSLPPTTTTNNNTNPSSTTSSPPSSVVPAPHHRDSPAGDYIKPLLSSTPPASLYNTSNAAIWSPASIDSCLDRSGYPGLGVGVGFGTGGGGGGVSMTTGATQGSVSSSNCYPPPHQSYGAYYTNMDYLGQAASAMSHSQLAVAVSTLLEVPKGALKSRQGNSHLKWFSYTRCDEVPSTLEQHGFLKVVSPLNTFMLRAITCFEQRGPHALPQQQPQTGWKQSSNYTSSEVETVV